MTLDINTAVFLPHKEKLAFRAIQRQLRGMLRRQEPLEPTKTTAAHHLLDVLESWSPLDAGEGSFSITAKGVGALNIVLEEGCLTIHITPMDSTFEMDVEPSRVFFVDGECMHNYWTQSGMAFAVRILRYLNLQNDRYGTVTEMEVSWTSKTNMVPSLGWVALREAALKEGHEPPRACHWMAEQL